MTQLKLEEVLAKVDDIDVLPTVISEVIKISRDPDSTITDMENTILADQTLTSKVLRLANSAYYGYARRISTISQATILLGFDTIRSMAIASTVSTMLSDEFKGYALDEDELWIQSQTCAIIARHMAQRTEKQDPEEAYIAGLLRDIGKTVLNQYMVDDYNKVLKIILTERVNFSRAEEMVFGFDHAEIGSEVAKKWSLPDNLTEAIKYHHSPEGSDSENKELISIVHIADAMTMMMGVGVGLDGLLYEMSTEALETLEIDTDDFKTIILESADLLKDKSIFMID